MTAAHKAAEGDSALLDFEELQELIRLFEATGLSEIEVEENGKRIRLAKAVISETHLVPMQEVKGNAAPKASPPVLNDLTESLLAEGLVTVDSPMVGTYYASSGPGASPFVQVGDTVDANQVVCIVEAMKIMNEVVSKVPAIVERILVRNGEPVEYGQPLIAVRPLA
ncbi:MAG: acetyl-CoA carboxylase biotin carboxyl carrier protein [Candidatus Hydrogenedentes bacterium]|nr:acetyl-CoA carboxylase biotin carboxyl carrier protein [Candidatus Hydrogenedentota bacterium]